jgi:hypothetical protein
MKTIKFLVAIMLLTSVSLSAQTPAKKYPAYVVDRCTKAKEQAKIDLKLSNEEAQKYYDISVESGSATFIAVRKLSDPDEISKCYLKGYENGKQMLTAAFGEDKASEILTWQREYNAKLTAQGVK